MNYKTFPFAVGINYPLRYNSFIEPELPIKELNKFLDKEVILYCHGGILESYLSLSFAEAYSQLKPNKKIMWSGKELFKPLLEMNSLCKFVKLNIDIDQYPVPLFFNKDRTHSIFNVLNNYLNVKNVRNEVRYRSTRSFANQIFGNSFLPWDKNYIPKLRSGIPTDLASWMNKANLKKSNAFIVLFPDDTLWSMHKETICMNWTPRDVRSFSSMLTNTHYKLLICTHNPNLYYGTRCYFPPMKVDNVLWLLQMSDVILSKEPDYLMLGVLMSNGMSYSYKVGGEFGSRKNSKYLGMNWNIEYLEEMSPIEIYNKII